MDGPYDSRSQTWWPRPSSIGTTIAGYRHGRPRISSSRWHYYAILIDDLPNKTTSKIVHQQWYDIKILFSTYVHCIITIYDCCGVAIVTADRHVYIIVASGHFIVHPPIQPKQVDIWYNKSCEFYWSHPHVRTHLCAHANYPHPYNKTPNDKAYNMWSICGLGCVNGTIRKNDNGEMYKWFGIHNNQLYCNVKMGR